jgi:hypothetical protein
MEKHYVKTKKEGIEEVCTERCIVKDDGTMIGSGECLQCVNNIENNFLTQEGMFGVSWLICSKIEEASPKH